MSLRNRVLIVDDYVPYAAVCQDLLRSECEVVGIAHDGLQLLDRAAAILPDLVILDLHMPRLDGIHAAKLLRTMMPSVKLIFVTASEWVDEEALCKETGACAVVFKARGHDLRAAVKLALGPSPDRPRMSAA